MNPIICYSKRLIWTIILFFATFGLELIFKPSRCWWKVFEKNRRRSGIFSPHYIRLDGRLYGPHWLYPCKLSIHTNRRVNATVWHRRSRGLQNSIMERFDYHVESSCFDQVNGGEVIVISSVNGHVTQIHLISIISRLWQSKCMWYQGILQCYHGCIINEN